MSNVHALTDYGPVLEPDQEIIGRLTELLDMAKRGEIKGFGYTVIAPNDEIGTGWIHGRASAHLMVTATSGLAYRVTKEWAEGE